MEPHFIEIKSIHGEENHFIIDVFELTQICPFEVKRIYTLKTIDKDSNRGKHAHLNQSQILYLQEGKAEVTLMNEYGNITIWELSEKCLFIPEKYWIDLHMAAHSIILCIASQPYDSLITVFDKKSFLNLGA